MSPIARNDSPVKTTSDGVFNYVETMARLGGDAELYGDLVRFFLEDADELLQRLSTKLAANELREVERCAHSLKGLCANFGAQRAMTSALALEDAARTGQTASLPQAARELEASVLQLKNALSTR